MDENNNSEELEKQHTEKNTKDALQAVEKGAALYFGGPEGTAAVNALHNAPVIGNALNKVEDKAVEKLGKNKNLANLTNKLGDSGITDAANKGLDAVGTAGGGGAGASSSATSAAKGINEGLGKIPSGSGGSDKSGGSGESKDEEEVSASTRTIEDGKKALNVIKVVSPFLPIIGGALVTLLVVVMVVAEIMAVRDQIVGVIGAVGDTGQKLHNFVSGNGWNTESELFFVNLKFANEKYGSESGVNLDIPLVAATIHYSKVTDISNWDGDEGEHNDDVGTDQDNYSDSQDSGIGAAIVETYQTWSYYKVANAKLGSWTTFIPGGRGILGHLVSSELTTKKECFSNISQVYSAWDDFLSKIFYQPDWKDYAAAYNTTPEAVAAFVSSIITFPKTINEIKDFYENLIAFNMQGQSYTEWWQANIVYEMKELVEYLTGNMNDEKLKSYPSSYYNGLEGKETSLFRDLFSIVEESLKSIASFKIDLKNMCGYVTVPDIKYSIDYKGYYRYLVDVYIPITYFRNEKLGEDYTYLEVINIANMIFDQKYLYEYLVGEDNQLYSGCNYSYTGSSSQTVTVNKNMIDNLYVNVMSGNCSSANSCTSVEETVSLKDYVIGVVYREIGASTSDNEDYLKANIIAAKSYTVGRRAASESGGKYYIKMLNSTNDQVYCSITKGCSGASSNAKPAPSAALISYLGRLYDEVYNSFLYNSSTSNFTGSYRAKESQCIKYVGACLGQVESKSLALSGKNYQAILGYFYMDPIGIVDISTGDFNIGVMQCISPGLKLGTDGYYIRTTTPTAADTYFNQPYVSDSNRGQCVWYVKGRAQEIVANSISDSSKKETAKNTLMGMTGNGNQWYSSRLTSVFGSSQSYTQPKAGSIAVYDWTDSRCQSYWAARGQTGCPEKYGHSLIVESVNGDSVTISEGYTSCSTGSPSWSCVKFNTTTYSISEMDDLGGRGYIFIGYIYLLD